MITRPNLTVTSWADSGDRTQPLSGYIESGFPRSPDKPTRQTMNWVLWYATNGVQYLMSRGIPEWGSTQNYSPGDVVRFGSKFYSAIIAHNNRIPQTDTAAWQLWYVFPEDLNTLYPDNATFTASVQNLQNQINNIGSGTGGGGGPADWDTLLNKPPVSYNAGNWLTGVDSNFQSNGWMRTNDSIQVYSNDWQHRLIINYGTGSANPLIASDTHIIQTEKLSPSDVTVTNFVTARGYTCRSGINGVYNDSVFNMFWEPNRMHVYADSTDLGWLQTASPSDYRLKNNIQPITHALPLVMKLHPVTFNWLGKVGDDGLVHAGFLAHEVQEIFAGAVDGEKDALTSDGVINPQYLNQPDIIALLTRAIQELNNRLSLLEDEHGISN